MNQGVVKVKEGYRLRFGSHRFRVDYKPKLTMQNLVNVALTKTELYSIKSQLIKVTLTQVHPKQLLNFNIT